MSGTNHPNDGRGGPSPPAAAAEASGNAPLRPMWQCDICHRAAFETREEAEAHERRCAGDVDTDADEGDDKPSEGNVAEGAAATSVSTAVPDPLPAEGNDEAVASLMSAVPNPLSAQSRHEGIVDGQAGHAARAMERPGRPQPQQQLEQEQQDHLQRGSGTDATNVLVCPPTASQPRQEQQQQQQQQQEQQQPDQSHRKQIGQRGEEKTEETEEPSLTPEEMETWAASLVGRWWEVFWEPEGTDGPEKKKGEMEADAKEGAMVVDLTHGDDAPSKDNGREGAVEAFLAGRMGTAAPAPLGSLQGLRHQTQQQMQQQHIMQQMQQQQRPAQPQLRPRRFNAVYTSPALGLSLAPNLSVQNVVAPHTSLQKVVVRKVNADAPNGELIQPNDTVVGVNGREFPPVAGLEGFHAVIGMLKATPRPMVVTFERMVEVHASSAMAPVGGPMPATNVAKTPPGFAVRYLHSNSRAEDMDNIPLNHLPKKREYLDDSSDDDGGSEDDGDDGEDDIDWYDAKILSYNTEDKQFVVCFLGDTPGVTYTMALTPKVVRPSVRAWTKRTLALLHGQGDVRTFDEGFLKALPPSTNLPEDAEELRKLRERRENAAEGGSMLKYKKLLAEQQYLATRLSPHDDDDDEEDGDEGSNEDGPGPVADSVYVRNLCECMKEAEKACDWFMNETVLASVLSAIRDGSQSEEANSTTKVSKEAILSFLVNGARFLNRMLASDPSNRSAPTKPRGGKRGRRKKRRSSTDGTNDGVVDDGVFDALLSKALVSNDALVKMLKTLLKRTPAPKANREVLITSMLTEVVSTLFDKLWTPVTDWLHRSEDMIGGKSGQFYSFGEVEAHLQTAQVASLSLTDLSEWTGKLVAKLSRARLFEMETWNCIKACVQPVISSASNSSGGDDKDECLSALQRLKKEASPMSSPGGSSVADQPMRNLNPLGRHLVDSSGLTMPSSLTRAVINDAISVRQWVLDLNQARTVRERMSFVQKIIDRYVILPQLPTPPFGGLDGTVANPSAILSATSKDSVTILSSSCYAHSHIIGNYDLRLHNSMDTNQNQDSSLRSKEGVASALAELTKVPILSPVEEKLYVREELLEWNDEAQQMIAASANSKLPFIQIEALYKKLLGIIDLKSIGRSKVCQKLKPDQLTDDQVRAFAVADEKVICSETGTWIRDQYIRISDWMAKYRSVISTLHFYDSSLAATPSSAAPAQGNLVEISRITELLKEHDAGLVVSFPDEYNQMDRCEKKALQWTDAVHQIVVVDSLSLEERCKQLADALNLRPKGIVIDPTEQVIELWIRVFTWRLNLQRGIQMISDRLASWKNRNPESPMMMGDPEMLGLIRSILAPVIIEGQDFLLSQEDTAQPFLAALREEVLGSIQTSSQPSIGRREVDESGIDGKKVLDLILDKEEDRRLDFSLLASRRIFWMMIYQRFFDYLSQSKLFAGSLVDAKALFDLCPHGGDTPTTLFLDPKVQASRLQQLITDAEHLQHKSSAALSQCSSLTYQDKEALRACLSGLSAIQLDFNNDTLALAVKLLGGTHLREKLDRKISHVGWLVSTFAYDIFSPSSQNDDMAHRIHFNNLRDLHNRIPSTVGPQWQVEGDSLGNDTVRVSNMVKALWHRANQWKTKVASLLPKSNDIGATETIVELNALTKITGDHILSKVIMPELEKVQQVSSLAHQFKESLDGLFKGEYSGATDVNKARLPDGKSLMERGGEFILHRFTGSEMYKELFQALPSLQEKAEMLPVMSPQKALLLWMTEILQWVQSIQSAEEFHNEQLVIKIDRALELLEQGHKIFFSTMEEVQSYLRGEKVGLQVFPGSYDVVVLKGGTYSLGTGLLRWGALLFECLQSDIDREDSWKERVLKAINTFAAFELGSIGGQVVSFKDATAFKDNVKSLITEASDLIIQDNELMHSLSSLPMKMNASALFQRCLEWEKNAEEQRVYNIQKEKYESPKFIVDDRYDLLDSVLKRLPPPSTELDSILEKNADDNSLFGGDPTARDKSRLFLEKSLLTGMETLGIDTTDVDAQDFCSLFAWELEDAVFEKFNSSSASISSEYRDKVRSLRFNLQDPKNPILCARVLGGNLPISELITASTEALASNEMKMMRQQVSHEQLKNVVLSANSTNQKPPSAAISGEFAAKIHIESVRARSQASSNSTEDEAHLHASQMSPALYSPSLQSSSPEQHVMKKTNEILAALPPPPMSRSKRDHAHGTELPSPPPSPLLEDRDTSPAAPPVAKSHARHINSSTGTDLFQITISKLKTTFTTKIAVDDSCPVEVEGYLPTTLVEKGRLSLDDFNKFISEKTRSSRWNIFHLKLSSISSDSTSSYKRFYKEYESLGRLAMIQVSDTTKMFLVTPKFLRVAKCLQSVENLSRSSTYVVVLTRDYLSPRKS